MNYSDKKVSKVITLFQSFINKYYKFLILQCSISECKEKAIQTVKISFKENRNLCKKHLKIFANKDEKYAPTFSKASDF